MKRLVIVSVIAVLGLTYGSHSLAMRTMEFLEKFDLKDLTYITEHSIDCGGTTRTEATVVDPEGLPHRVRIGNYVGKDFGMVTRITTDSIELMEVIQNKSGEWVERPTALPKKRGALRVRHGYEESHALEMLAKMDDSGKQLKERLIQCSTIVAFEDDAKRLACFDAAVATPLR